MGKLTWPRTAESGASWTCCAKEGGTNVKALQKMISKVALGDRIIVMTLFPLARDSKMVGANYNANAEGTVTEEREELAKVRKRMANSVDT